MADLKRWSEHPRSVAAAVVLQLYGGIDPDYSRDLADRIVFAIDRAAGRNHAGAPATDDEVQRALAELRRRGIQINEIDAKAALDAALVRGWGS